MRNAFYKDLLREVKGTFGRFLAIFTIVVLGVSFFAGLGVTGNNMKQTADKYFVNQSLMDLRVVCTYGLNKKDVEAIGAAPGVVTVYPAYNLDAEAIAGSGYSSVVKVHSISSGDSEPGGPINKPVLKSGRLPQKPNEAVAEPSMFSEMGFKIGDKVTLSGGSKNSNIRNRLKNTSYELVGIVESPYYISLQRGTGSIGDGRIDYFMYIPDDNFLQDVYSEAFVSVSNKEGVSSFSEAYEVMIDSVVDALEEIGKVRSRERLSEMKAGPYAELLAAEVETERMLRDTEAQFAESETQLADARLTLDESRRDLDVNRLETTSGFFSIAEAESQVFFGLGELNKAEEELTKQGNELTESAPEIERQINALISNRKELQERQVLVNIAYRDDPDILRLSIALIEESLSRIQSALSELYAARAELDRGVSEVESAKIELDIQRSSLYDNLRVIQSEKAELVDAESEIIGAYSELANRQYLLDSNSLELEMSRQSSIAELNGALLSIRTSLKSLDDISEPEWFVLDRDTNAGYSSFSEDSDKIDAIGRIFPLIFFLVAALVSLTTMTRLVDERRVEIGTLKALGYGNIKVMSKYIFYAFAPTLTGGLFGGYAGMKVYPAIIIDAYNMLYSTPKAEPTADFGYWSIGILLAVFCTVGAAIFSCSNELKEMPSALLRPKAPASGRRTFLEKISIIWNNLTFIHKVTVRNIIRYKKRFWMTVTGIAGCSALLLTAFGLRDSVAGIMSVQYGDLFKYDLVTTFSDDIKQNEVKKVAELITSSPFSSASLRTYSKVLDAGVDGIRTLSVNLMVAEDMNRLSDIITFRFKNDLPGARTGGASLTVGSSPSLTGSDNPRANDGSRLVGDNNPGTGSGASLVGGGAGPLLTGSGASLTGGGASLTGGGASPILTGNDNPYADNDTDSFHFEKDSVIITEKLSTLLDLDVGDYFFIKDGDSTRVEARVGAITEHYLGHYIYMDKELYRDLFREAPEYNTIYTVLKNPESDDKIEMAMELLSKKSVNSVWFTSSAVESFQHVVDGLNFVILVLTFSAGALALVVLLNLTSINISERIRELATIEVLGFYDRETASYVYRENAVLTSVGIIVGLALGKLLHLYVILTVETEIMMFSRRIEPLSYLYSALLTVFFSICVNLLTGRRLRRINMVEALKSIE